MVCIVEDSISTASVLWRFTKPDIDILDPRDLQVCFLELCYIKKKIYTLSPA